MTKSPGLKQTVKASVSIQAPTTIINASTQLVDVHHKNLKEKVVGWINHVLESCNTMLGAKLEIDIGQVQPPDKE